MSAIEFPLSRRAQARTKIYKQRNMWYECLGICLILQRWPVSVWALRGIHDPGWFKYLYISASGRQVEEEDHGRVDWIKEKITQQFQDPEIYPYTSRHLPDVTTSVAESRNPAMHFDALLPLFTEKRQQQLKCLFVLNSL